MTTIISNKSPISWEHSTCFAASEQGHTVNSATSKILG